MNDRYVILDKVVGETPLDCLERYRSTNVNLVDVPMAYAGRLDPMASGKLLVLIGEECKRQEDYHALDKEYVFSVLFGVASDTGDVLGRLKVSDAFQVSDSKLHVVSESLIGDITLSYPAYSSKTVQGIPLHTWAVSGRLDEIEIPTYTSSIYNLEYLESTYLTGEAVHTDTLTRINSLPPVTDPKKSLGNDFRRTDVRADWQRFKEEYANSIFQIAHFRCVSASGAYMRSLAEVIADNCNTLGLAFSIHRTKIGNRKRLPILGLNYFQKL